MFITHYFPSKTKSDTRYLENWRLDALAELVADVDVSGHFGQDISPEGGLFGSGPAVGCRVAGCVLQLHAQLRSGCFCGACWASRHAHYRRSRFAAARAHLWRARRNYFKLPPLRKEKKNRYRQSGRHSWYSRKSPSTRARAQSSLRVKQHAKIITEDNVL